MGILGIIASVVVIGIVIFMAYTITHINIQ